jgi:hypothetical protein
MPTGLDESEFEADFYSIKITCNLAAGAIGPSTRNDSKLMRATLSRESRQDK